MIKKGRKSNYLARQELTNNKTLLLFEIFTFALNLVQRVFNLSKHLLAIIDIKWSCVVGFILMSFIVSNPLPLRWSFRLLKQLHRVSSGDREVCCSCKILCCKKQKKTISKISGNGLIAFLKLVLTRLDIDTLSYSCLVGYYRISTFVGYLTPNPYLCK